MNATSLARATTVAVLSTLIISSVGAAVAFADTVADTVAVTGVSLNESSNTLTVGGTDQLLATIAPSNATNQSVTWSSGNTAVATVSSTGLVTAVSVGMTGITATTADGNFIATDSITVDSAPVTAPVTTPTTPTVTPSVNSSVLGAAAYNFTKNLGIGSTGADVKELQQFLINAGYSLPAGATGYYGAQTKDAVIAFQKARGIAQVGTVGPLTRAELNKGDAVAATSGTTSTSSTPSGLTSVQINAIIGILQSFGADASTIAQVQAALQ